MTTKTRTIEELRNSFEGKVYVRCSSEKVFRRFLEDAEAEGYLIGDKKPTEAGISQDIMAVEYDRRISTCGIIAHIACGAGADNVHIIDYGKYISGDSDCEVSRL